MNRQHRCHKSAQVAPNALDRRGFLGALGLSGLGFGTALAQLSAAPGRWVPVERPNQPLGRAKGIFPGRVVWTHQPRAATWDDTSGAGWWEDRFTDPVLAAQMLSTTLQSLTGAESDEEAWERIFRHYNRTHGRGDVGYRPGEKVAVKLNMNCSDRRKPSSYGLYNTPQLTRALLRQLVRQAGVRESDIVVCDASRWMHDSIFLPCHAEFPKIRFEDLDGLDGRFKAEPDKNVAIHFGDPSTPYSGETHLLRALTSATYLINAALMKGHSLAAVTLCAKNHFGSVHRRNTGPADPHKGWNPSHVHKAITVRTCPMETYNALVDFMGHKDLGGKTILYLIDALYASPHQSVRPEKWWSSPFDGHWTASVFASLDPVALESVVVDFFGAEKSVRLIVGAVDNYLHEAALADQPPSKTRYAPDGNGRTLSSLGVHEHWNSPEKKQYSRNLDTGQGIELVTKA
ncbi:MAG TPA: DUF362 domain-containing protein [Planctomycetes bacterium]|nr:DUF362 domain-containing protein [Planctomycetota bacterium]